MVVGEELVRPDQTPCGVVDEAFDKGSSHPVEGQRKGEQKKPDGSFTRYLQSFTSFSGKKSPRVCEGVTRGLKLVVTPSTDSPLLRAGFCIKKNPVASHHPVCETQSPLLGQEGSKSPGSDQIHDHSPHLAMALQIDHGFRRFWPPHKTTLHRCWKSAFGSIISVN